MGDFQIFPIKFELMALSQIAPILKDIFEDLLKMKIQNLEKNLIFK